MFAAAYWAYIEYRERRLSLSFTQTDTHIFRFPEHLWSYEVMVLLFAFLIGAIAGLRTFTAPTVISWAAWSGRFDLAGTWTTFLGYSATPWVMTWLAICELVADKHPATPSRKKPLGFTARIFSGALSGAAVGSRGDHILLGAIIGIAGAVAGTLAGAEGRKQLAKQFGKDWPAAVIEDIVAIGGAALVVALVS
jgi:uncharacterized membrane protein